MRQVGSGTEVDKVSLLVARNLGATFVTDKFDLQVFTLLGENLFCVPLRHLEPDQFLVGFNQPAHPFFDNLKVFWGEGIFTEKVIIEAIGGWRPDPNLNSLK